MKFGALHHILNPITVTWPKIEIFKIRDGGGRHLANRFFWPLLINRLSDFREILYEEAERHADKGYGTKMQMCKIQDGGRPPFWKSLNRHISVKNCPILMKFSTQHQILNPVTVTWPKIEIFGIQDGGGRNLKNRFFVHYSSTDCRISAKFCARKQNGMLTRATGQKMQLCKIQDGGRPPFWKLLNSYISVKNWPILMKFGTLHHWTRLRSRDQKLKILNSRWPRPPSWKSLFWP